MSLFQTFLLLMGIYPMIRIHKFVNSSRATENGKYKKHMFFYISDTLISQLNDNHMHSDSAENKKQQLSKYYVSASDIADFIVDTLDFGNYPIDKIYIDAYFLKEYYEDFFVSEVPSKNGKQYCLRARIVRDYLFEDNCVSDARRTAGAVNVGIDLLDSVDNTVYTEDSTYGDRY